MGFEFEAVLKEASQLYDDKKFDEAEPLYLSLLKGTNKGYADIFNKLGLISHLKGDFQTASDFFQKALQINSKYTECSLNLAVTYNDMGKFDEAREVFNKALQIVQTSPNTIDPFIQGKLASEHKRLGEQYKDLGLYDQALEEFQKALTHRPNLVDIITLVGITLREKGRLDDSIRVLMRAKEVNPSFVPAMIQLGVTYYIKGFSNLARVEWEEAQAIDPEGKDAGVYLALAKKDEV
ncbi:MAG: tetratricopeptide repeat protein [Nitrospirae bacterium]|nr:tetratricopeptide repeat protein [Nitrospirota bacterium]MBI3594006.1 tetratricopeptide repeat protein [Nitrospirota bacterium]